jgi:DNA-binding response OmpR family regulator
MCDYPCFDGACSEYFPTGFGESGQSSNEKRRNMKRVLVVEDDEMVRALLRSMLETAGYEVEELPNGVNASRLQEKNPFDVIILDILMPEKDGFEIIQEFKVKWPTLPIIAISGGGVYSPSDCLRLAKSFGADRNFIKPVERGELLTAVEELLREFPVK